MKIDVVLTPLTLSAARTEGFQIVVIDVLRATTTMVTALANGASAIIPVNEPAEAVETREKLDRDNTLLGGEKDALPIENFDLSNSPLEYTAEAVSGKTIVMRTTNGATTLKALRASGAVWIGAFVNLSAVAGAIQADGSDLLLVCSGNYGDYSMEDTLCAGGIIDRLADLLTGKIDLNDSAKLALLHYNANCERLAQAIAAGEHGRLLTSLGCAEDIAFAAQVDSIDLAPRYSEGRVVRA